MLFSGLENENNINIDLYYRKAAEESIGLKSDKLFIGVSSYRGIQQPLSITKDIFEKIPYDDIGINIRNDNPQQFSATYNGEMVLRENDLSFRDEKRTWFTFKLGPDVNLESDLNLIKKCLEI